MLLLGVILAAIGFSVSASRIVLCPAGCDTGCTVTISASSLSCVPKPDVGLPNCVRTSLTTAGADVGSRNDSLFGKFRNSNDGGPGTVALFSDEDCTVPHNATLPGARVPSHEFTGCALLSPTEPVESPLAYRVTSDGKVATASLAWSQATVVRYTFPPGQSRLDFQSVAGDSCAYTFTTPVSPRFENCPSGLSETISETLFRRGVRGLRFSALGDVAAFDADDQEISLVSQLVGWHGMASCVRWSPPLPPALPGLPRARAWPRTLAWQMAGVNFFCYSNQHLCAA